MTNDKGKKKLVHFKGAVWRKVTDCGRSGPSLEVTRNWQKVTCKTCLKAIMSPFTY